MIRPNTTRSDSTGGGYDPFKTVPDLTMPKEDNSGKEPFGAAGGVTEKKEKKNFKIGHFKPSFIKKDKDKNKSSSSIASPTLATGGAKVIKNDLGNRASPLPSAPPQILAEETHLRLASDASKKETERLERLRIQEEQDLAYAIALSKAEAASVNNQ